MKELFNTLSNVSNFFQEKHFIYWDGPEAPKGPETQAPKPLKKVKSVNKKFDRYEVKAPADSSTIPKDVDFVYLEKDDERMMYARSLVNTQEFTNTLQESLKIDVGDFLEVPRGTIVKNIAKKVAKTKEKGEVTVATGKKEVNKLSTSAYKSRVQLRDEAKSNVRKTEVAKKEAEGKVISLKDRWKSMSLKERQRLALTRPEKGKLKNTDVAVEKRVVSLRGSDAEFIRTEDLYPSARFLYVIINGKKITAHQEKTNGPFKDYFTKKDLPYLTDGAVILKPLSLDDDFMLEAFAKAELDSELPPTAVAKATPLKKPKTKLDKLIDDALASKGKKEAKRIYGANPLPGLTLEDYYASRNPKESEIIRDTESGMYGTEEVKAQFTRKKLLLEDDAYATIPKKFNKIRKAVAKKTVKPKKTKVDKAALKRTAAKQRIEDETDDILASLNPIKSKPKAQPTISDDPIFGAEGDTGLIKPLSPAAKKLQARYSKLSKEARKKINKDTLSTWQDDYNQALAARNEKKNKTDEVTPKDDATIVARRGRSRKSNRRK